MDNQQISKNAICSQSLDQALDLLQVITDADSCLRLTDIADILGTNKTTATRFINSFIKKGYLERVIHSKHVTLGPRTASLGYAFSVKSRLMQQIKPWVDEAYISHGLHCDVVLLFDEKMLLVYRRESPDTLVFQHFTSENGFYYLATGKALLAFMPKTERDSILNRLHLMPKSQNTITDRSELLAELKISKKRGYAVNNEESITGLVAIGAPLFNMDNMKVIGAVSLDASTEKTSMADLEKYYAKPIMELAKKLSVSMRFK
jgi:DNA-binding IclR family transcriptional regulator